MGQTVYADLYFMINLSMDFLCFFISAKLLSIKFNPWRVFLSSALGGAYAVLALFLSVGRVFALLVDISVCAMLCIIAFARKGEWRATWSYIPVYIAVSIVFGGVMSAIFTVLNRLELPLPASDSDGISVWSFAIVSLLGGVAVLFGGRFFARRGARKNAELTLFHGKKSVCVRALCDSGNLLRDPISQSPCIVVDRSVLQKLLPKDIIQTMTGGASEISDISKENASRIRIVPARSATGERLLVAFRADLVEIDAGKGKRAVDALIVASDIGSTADGSYALIPPEILS